MITTDLVRKVKTDTTQFRRDGREAEGAPLLREYRVYSSIEGSNPSLSAIFELGIMVPVSDSYIDTMCQYRDNFRPHQAPVAFMPILRAKPEGCSWMRADRLLRKSLKYQRRNLGSA